MRIVDISHTLVYNRDNMPVLSIYHLCIHACSVSRAKLIQNVKGGWRAYMYDGYARGRLYANVLTQQIKVANRNK